MNKRTYTVSTRCENCGRTNDVTLSFGESLGTVVCETCGTKRLGPLEEASQPAGADPNDLTYVPNGP